MKAIKKNNFIIPAFFYKGKYLKVMESDKDKWDKAVEKYRKFWSSPKETGDDEIPF